MICVSDYWGLRDDEPVLTWLEALLQASYSNYVCVSILVTFKLESLLPLNHKVKEIFRDIHIWSSIFDSPLLTTSDESPFQLIALVMNINDIRLLTVTVRYAIYVFFSCLIDSINCFLDINSFNFSFWKQIKFIKRNGLLVLTLNTLRLCVRQYGKSLEQHL